MMHLVMTTALHAFCADFDLYLTLKSVKNHGYDPFQLTDMSNMDHISFRDASRDDREKKKFYSGHLLLKLIVMFLIIFVELHSRITKF